MADLPRVARYGLFYDVPLYESLEVSFCFLTLISAEACQRRNIGRAYSELL